MEPSEFVRVVKRYWVLVVVAGLLGAVVAGALAMTTRESYRATSSVYVSSQRGQTVQELVQGSTYTQDQVESFSRLATMPVVLDPVIKKLGLDTTAQALDNQVSANIPLNTVIIEITVTSGSPGEAARIANAVSESLGTEVERLAPPGPNNRPSVVLNTVSAATQPNAPFAPNTRLYVIAGLAIGILLAVLYVLIREVLDTRIRRDRDVHRVADTPVLASLARLANRRTASSVMITAPQSTAAESYRLLRTNLEFMEVDARLRTVVVSSPAAGEGKTSTAVALALAIAESGARVLLVDADLRRPGVADRLQIEASVGLSSVLIEQATLQEAVVRVETIDVLPSGPVPPNPNQLLNSASAENVLTELGRSYDLIVVDSPPLLPVTDTLPLAKLADGTILVVRAGATRRAQLRDAIEALNTINAKVLGVAINGVRLPRSGAYYRTDARSEPLWRRAVETMRPENDADTRERVDSTAG
ncbi:hypothetical protein BGP79_10140 [Tersicoccus sp. Bi-70]|nr:hypothetical protein BGP79_10140 [Tersicoccus sp. Bi-70]